MNSLYVLTCLPSPLIRKIWHYIGSGTQSADLIKEHILYWSIRESNDRWMDTNTFLSLNLTNLVTFTNHVHDYDSRISISLWCEYRILIRDITHYHNDIINQSYHNLWALAFRSKHKIVFNWSMLNR